MKIETVVINFKGLGIKARINKTEFNPTKHKLWTFEDEEALKAPFPRKQIDTESEVKEPGKPGRPAKIRNE